MNLIRTPPSQKALQGALSVANYTIRRAYLFSAETGGNLYATSKFATPFTKTSDYTFKVNWEITYE